MNERCPACGWRFERDPGYFTGAMYGSYGLGLMITLPVCLGMLFAGASFIAIMAVTVLLLAVAFPLMFRYSRVLWMHWDVYFNGTGPADEEGPVASPGPRR
jgi:hypothetical protein